MKDRDVSERQGAGESPDGRAAAKARLRRAVLARRSALPADVRARASAAICARAAALPEFAHAATVMLFASFSSEVDTSALVAQALADGKTVCLPRVLAPHQMAAFRVTDPAGDLVPGTWGIPEPRAGLPEVDPAEIDAVVVPGVVFDLEGRRFGYGGGFYDTYLARTRAGVPRIALAFDVQLVEVLETEPHDLPMGVVVTESRVIHREG